MRKIWVLPEGLLLERQQLRVEEAPMLPTLFSLLHPLEEICPVSLVGDSSGDLRV